MVYDVILDFVAFSNHFFTENKNEWTRTCKITKRTLDYKSFYLIQIYLKLLKKNGIDIDCLHNVNIQVCCYM